MECLLNSNKPELQVVFHLFTTPTLTLYTRYTYVCSLRRNQDLLNYTGKVEKGNGAQDQTDIEPTQRVSAKVSNMTTD